MKLIDLQLTNFKKLSNIPQPTISFNEDITVLVGANNAGKTSILKAIQILFNTEQVIPKRDLNYLVDNGILTIEGSIRLTKQQWLSYLHLGLGSLSRKQDSIVDIDDLSEKLYDFPFSIKHEISFINQSLSKNERVTEIERSIFDSIAPEASQRVVVRKALDQLSYSDFYNVYHTPLYLDSKGEIQDEEKFIPLSQIKSQRWNGNKPNIRGLLYSLKKEEPEKFREFKSRLLEIFTELEDMDVRNNEELGQFELVLFEKLKKNGDSKEVTYDIKNVGQGMQSLVLMLTNILLLKPSIVLMDEPEVHMHPSLIKEFVRYVKQLSKDTQFIITTHSVVLMNEVGLDKLYLLKYEAEQKGVVATKVDGRNKFLATVISLGYEVDGLIYSLKPKVFVFTEGSSDKDLILAFASKKGLGHDLNMLTVGFISMGGKGNRYKLANLIDKLNKEFISSPLIMILDRDETSPEQVEDIKNKFFAQNPKRLHYLSKRQIENYLLDERAIKKYVSDRIIHPSLQVKWLEVNINAKFLELAELQREDILNKYIAELFIGDSLFDTQSIRLIINSLGNKPLKESVREFKGEMAKQITLRTDDLGQKTTSAVEEFNNRWIVAENMLDMIDGRELLKDFNRWAQTEFNVSFSCIDIINEMESIPPEIDSLIEQLTKPQELKSIN